MHLKTLTMRGFKSFATATTVRFEPGINAVVGPNGSGKSNVVDALAWVMGEQGAKTLRGGSMADVIFAGTSRRPALGRAEVSLTIDNSDGVLPIEYSEVTITRTLFRAGGSEYAINGTPARLLDVQELLSDTGMGREMHVIIGQGRLDEVLTSSPEERRNIVEEAAGVLKHRRRKEKTLRKLEAMKGSFTRVEDLTAELRRQLGPLAKQAEAARRAQVIQATERDARARLLADDLAQAQARLEAGTAEDNRTAQLREENQAALTQARAALAAAEEHHARLNPQLSALRDSSERLASLEERFRAMDELARERERTLSTMPARGGQDDPEELRARAVRARAEEEELEGRVRDAQDALRAVLTQREESETAEAAAERAYNEASRVRADARENAARRAGKVSAIRSRLEALTAEVERVDKDVAAARQRVQTTSVQVTDIEEELVATSAGDDTLATAHEEHTRSHLAARAAVEEARANEARAREEMARVQAIVDTLALSLEPEDATAWAIGHGAALLRDHLHVERGWESAAENALAGTAAGAVVDDLDSAVDILRGAAQAQAGRLTLSITEGKNDDAVTAAREAELSTAFETVRPDKDAAVHALAVVRWSGTGSDLAGLLKQLLAGTALTVDLVTARLLVAAGAPRAVTMSGDVITACTATGGEATAAATLARQAAYQDASEQLDAAATAADEAAVALRKAESAEEDARARAEASGSELTARDSNLAAATAQLGALRQALSTARADEERAVARAASLREDIAARQAELESFTQPEESTADIPDDGELARLSQQRDSAHEAAVAARKQETEARLALRTAEERFRALSGRADALDNRARLARERLEREERARQARAEYAVLAGQVAAAAVRALTHVRSLRAEVAEQRRRVEEEQHGAEGQLTHLREHVEQLRARERELADSTHARELATARARMEYEQLATRALEDLGVDSATLVEEFGPLTSVPTDNGAVPYVRAEQERRLATAQRALARLGTINPLALEEHAALEERQRYLAQQLDDLKKTRADLLDIVAELDERVTLVMKAALSDISARFEQVFARLFPGGEGRLIITDPENVLTTGVEIEARPPGKRVKRLSLLSGGERSLTAIAFLVAIFMALPSPFYVMDEVEAALDDVNLGRLLEIFRELQRSSQLLVITHQKRTMEIADALYGVAMREDGVSTVVSQRMSELRE
ncbi:chromosome segregation protein SMC [Actinotignum sanguinis]|uniref:Chromosome partition protein Smc n=3 Tax=Actinomycetaceae TaxID=2049 RepID=A0ABZ0REA9_9ACTO|nr:chromosome segregation protein SMC [Actinotignum sanguinis]WPJ89360.1 chromosome segregation protein SMC [Schaalia turicensis]MDE1552361.1 chromosome segregation protein SMC [Actinotignum sanguinis]MDE1565991.1 chromosome segregation protein SMC [Actinotignum sanguinis]MDE1577248.1 chromosome segregation protein SMC [Actinotignum sanguinis]MDE1641867.1 chromosome segregation protein SMC [Actinotignum sanguinis]